MPSRRTAAGGKAESEANVSEAKVTAKVHEAIEDVAEAQVARVEEQRRAALHPVLQFPLVAALSFALTSFGYGVLGAATEGELAAVSRSQDSWGEVAVLVGWRFVELGLGWFGRLDSWDVAMMDLLSHGPVVSLTHFLFFF